MLSVLGGHPGDFGRVVKAFPYVYLASHLLVWKATLATGIVAGATTPYLRKKGQIYGGAIFAGIVASLVVLPWHGDFLLVLAVLASAVAVAACTWLSLRMWRWRQGGVPISG